MRLISIAVLLCAGIAYGASVLEGGRVTFSLPAAKAGKVELRGQWVKEALPLTKGADGVWSYGPVEVPAGVWEYSFSVEGQNVIDPENSAIKPQRRPAKSILHVPANPPASWDWRDIPHGTLHTHVFHSKELGVPREMVVYTPPGYEKSDEKYPVFVLQHGSGDNQRGWTEHGKAHWIMDDLIAKKKARPMIVVMLDGHPHGMVRREDTEARDKALMAFWRELLDTALPLVESMYRVLPGRENTALAGLSMGGWQSLTVGLNALDRFAWIGSFSGAARPEALQAVMSEGAKANEKIRLLWIACGRDDFLLAQNEALIAQLKAAGVKHEWHLTAGDHSWPVWRGYLVEFAPLLFQP